MCMGVYSIEKVVQMDDIQGLTLRALYGIHFMPKYKMTGKELRLYICGVCKSKRVLKSRC